MKMTDAQPDSPAGTTNIIELRKETWRDVRDTFEKFCLTCGIEILQGDDRIVPV